MKKNTLVVNKNIFSNPTAAYNLLLGSAGVLIVLGLIMVLSASGIRSYFTSGSSFSIAGRQLMWFCVGIIPMWLAFKIPPKAWKRLIPAFLVIVFGLELAVFLPGIGIEINGNRNWINLGLFTIQPSEIAKFAITIWAAQVLAQLEKGALDQRRAVYSLIIGFGLISTPILAGGDLGTTLILAAILMALLFLTGMKYRHLFGIGLIGALLLFAVLMTRQSRLARLSSFLDPFAASNYHGAGWQPAHSIMALASGGIFGVGLGGSRQKWGNLGPEAHTDFIFAVIGEEMGLFGTVLVLLAFLAFIWAGINVAIKTKDPFTRYAVAGIVAWISVQVTINIASVIGMFPVVGVPLPFISYGGSALISSMMALGFLVGAARREPGAKEILDKRPPLFIFNRGSK
jgi:cell division protein FtsW